MSEKKPHILDFSLADWQRYMTENQEKNYRALQIFDHLHKKNNWDLDKLSTIGSALKEKIKQEFYLPPANTSLLKSRRLSDVDQTQKLLWSFENNKEVESVWLKYPDRISLCISVQAGCTLDCSFCATGKLPFKGNLSVGEILYQVYEAQKICDGRVRNVVFMGMGEPFYNYENSLKAAHILTEDRGANIGKRRITISTSGVLPGIQRFVEERQPFNLALSVHTLFSDFRRKIMEIEKKFPIESIIEYLGKNRNALRNDQLMLEYIMIDEVNIRPEDLKALIKTAKRIRAKVNLIPLNTSFFDMKRPSVAKIDHFWAELNKAKVVAINRKSPGLDIDAACGMLAKNQAESA